MRNIFLFSCAMLSLGACSTQQQTQAAAYVSTACAVASAAEAAAPSLTAHNVKIANGITYACATAPAAEALAAAFAAGQVPVVAASSTPQAVTSVTHPTP